MVDWNPERDGTVPRYDSTTASYVDSPVPATAIAVYADTDDGEAIVDCSNFAGADITLSDDTMIELQNVPDDGTAWTFLLVVRQGGDEDAPYGVTWPVTTLWEGGTAPTLSDGDGEVDVFRFTTTDGGTTWFGETVGQAFAAPS